MANGIFPNTIAKIFEYINLVVPYLLGAANRARLGLTGVTELDDADTIRTTTYNLKYAAAANPNTATKTVRTARDNAAKAIITKLTFVYGEIPDSALTDDDRALLNLHLRDSVPSDRAKIDSIPYSKFVSVGGGRIREISRTNSDDSRASIHPDADGVETVMVIVAVDAPPPVSPAACPIQKFSTTARFEIECGAENLGKRVYAFSRWKNNSDPSKSGPFSDVITTVIGGSGDGD